MTKPTLYAVAGSALPRAARRLALVVLWLAGATAARAQEPVCGACVALEITPTQTVALPPQLDGLEVLVRVRCPVPKPPRARPSWPSRIAVDTPA